MRQDEPEPEWSKPTKRMWACAMAQGGLGLMAAAIREGADVDAVNRHGVGAIEVAIANSKEPDKVRMLIDAGARGAALNRSYGAEMELARAVLEGSDAEELMREWPARAQRAALKSAVASSAPGDSAEPKRL